MENPKDYILSESWFDGGYVIKIFEPVVTDEEKLTESLEALSELYITINSENNNENRSSDI